MRVDIHSHVFLDKVFGLAGKYGPELVTDDDGKVALRVGSFKFYSDEHLLDRRVMSDPAYRVEQMDALGVDWMGVSTNPTYYLYWIEPDVAVPFAFAVNDALAEYCSAFPNRLYFNAHLPLQDIDAALKEMERAVKELGAKAINMGSDDGRGTSVADRRYWPIYEKATELDVPVFMHPYPVGTDGDPGDRSGTDSVYNYNTGGLMLWMAGYLHQETLAVMNLIFSGVFDEFPTLKFLIAHGGGAVPYQFGRFEYAAARQGASKAARPIREYLKHFYFDTVVHDKASRQHLVNFMGADNVVVGSNWPGWDAINGFDFVDELDLSENEKNKIKGTNAAELFRLG